jgi:hypothetical protein
MYKNYQEFKDYFLQIEDKSKLLDWRVKGVYVWQLIRTQLQAQLWNSNDNYSQIVSQSKITIISRIFKQLKFIFYIISKTPFLDFHKSEVLVFESTRSGNLNGKIVDPYIYPILDLIDPKMTTLYCTSNKNTGWDNFSIKELYPLKIFSKLLSRLIFVGFSSEEIEIISKIEYEISQYFNIKVDLKLLIKNKIKSFKSESLLYKIILKNKKPTQIWLVSYSNNPALINAAKNRGCLVNEIQHGLIGYEDLIYHYPNTNEGSLQYFPDVFYCWDIKYFQFSKFPIKKENKKTIQNKYLYEKSQFLKATKKQKQILIASQPDNTYRIAHFLYENINYFKGYLLVFKLHPVEKLDNKTQLLLTSLKNNIKIARPDKDIHALLAESICLISVYSTVVIEAPYFNCNVWLLDLPGIEMMKGYINNKVKILSEGKNIPTLLNELSSL